MGSRPAACAERGEDASGSEPVEERWTAQAQGCSPKPMGDERECSLADLFRVPRWRRLPSGDSRLPQGMTDAACPAPRTPAEAGTRRTLDQREPPRARSRRAFGPDHGHSERAEVDLGRYGRAP